MKDYTPAFPQGGAYLNKDGTLQSVLFENGMSLRDYFAAKALPVLVSNLDENFSRKDVAEIAYKYAEAMMEARDNND